MWQKLQAFVVAQKFSAHTIAVVALFLIGGYHQVQPFHDLVNSLYGSLPQTAKQAVASVVALGLFYWNTKKQQG
jgi:hypothetical protein